MNHSRYSSNAREYFGIDIYASSCEVPLGVRVQICSQSERWQRLYVEQQLTADWFQKKLRLL